MNSHVQIPKFFIRNFVVSCRNDESVYVYDFRNKTVHLESPEFIGVKEDYYDKDTEMYLSLNYEKPFYKIAYKIIDWDTNHPDEELTLSPKQCLDIRRFIMELRFRSPYMHQNLLKKLGPENVPTSPSTFVRGHDRDKNISKLFPDHVFVIVSNYSSVSFISSVRGYGHFFRYARFGKDNWWLPISPYVALASVNKKAFSGFFRGQNIVYFTAEGDVQYFNDMVLHQALSEYRRIVRYEGFDKYLGCVFSNDFDELKRLKKKDEEWTAEYERKVAIWNRGPLIINGSSK